MKTLYFEVGYAAFTIGVCASMGVCLIYEDGCMWLGSFFFVICFVLLLSILLRIDEVMLAKRRQEAKEIQAALDTQCDGLRETFCKICPKNQK
jgi:hypothetical protein